ncbi:hypothetical protein N9368_02540 [Alphaproteobacteria bacterium]|nr:hypothetical protein [Alphaproteobacteria bacterium]
MTRLEEPVPGQILLNRIFASLIMAVFLAPIMVFMATPMARAELRLDEWKSYGAMAEQGGVCAAFARIMELQSVIDAQTGKLWLERRKFSGAVVRQASILEGLEPVSADDINDLVNRYSIWLLTNLAADEDAQKLNAEAHAAASNMVSDVCAALYERADKAIFKKNPALQQCATPQTIEIQPTPVCEPPANNADTSGGDEDDRSQITALLRNNMRLSKELDDLRGELLVLKSPKAPANTPANTPATAPAKPKATAQAVSTPATTVTASTTATAKGTATATATPAVAAPSLPLPETMPVAKPGDHIPKMARNSIIAPEDTTLISSLTPSRDGTALPGPKFVAQLGSFRSLDSAKDGLAKMREQFPNALANIELQITTSKLATGEILNRLVTVGLPRDAATDVCAALWDKRLGCLLRAAK